MNGRESGGGEVQHGECMAGAEIAEADEERDQEELCKWRGLDFIVRATEGWGGDI